MKKTLCLLLLSASMINGMDLSRDGWRPQDRSNHQGDAFGDAVAMTTLLVLGGAGLLSALSVPGAGLYFMYDGLTCAHNELLGDTCCLDPAANSITFGTQLLSLSAGLAYLAHRGRLKLRNLTDNTQN